MAQKEEETRSTQLLLQQYKLYVQLSERTSARRAATNRFYLTLLTGLLALIGLGIERNLFAEVHHVVLMVAAALGVCLCWVWFANVRSYRQLNAAKFKVINEMERSLPCQCHAMEWEILGRGEKPALYRPQSHVEEWVPRLLVIPYLLLLAYALYLTVQIVLARYAIRI